MIQAEALPIDCDHRISHDICGVKFSRLLVLEYAGYKWRKNSNRKIHFIRCKCDCGEIGIHEVFAVKGGHTKSCGCLVSDTMIKRNFVHGHTDSITYKIWNGMKNRCLNPNSKDYDNYGGRGISICSRWLGEDGFINFLTDMGEKPKELTLERKDVNGNYCPENCCYTNTFNQSRNKRNNILV